MERRNGENTENSPPGASGEILVLVLALRPPPALCFWREEGRGTLGKGQAGVKSLCHSPLSSALAAFHPFPLPHPQTTPRPPLFSGQTEVGARPFQLQRYRGALYYLDSVFLGRYWGTCLQLGEGNTDSLCQAEKIPACFNTPAVLSSLQVPRYGHVCISFPLFIAREASRRFGDS